LFAWILEGNLIKTQMVKKYHHLIFIFIVKVTVTNGHSLFRMILKI